MDTVLVTAIGSFSASAVVSSLQGFGYRVVGCDIYRKELHALAHELDAFYQAPLASDVGAYIDFICTTIARESATYLMPLTDVEVDVLNEHRERIEAAGATLCLSCAETIRICRDKKAFFDFVTNRDLPIRSIPTTPLAGMGEPQSYPLIAKPAGGRSSEGLIIVRDLDDWRWAQAKAKDSDYIVQPKIEGYVVTVDVVRNSATGDFVAIPRREHLRTPNGAGTSVFVFTDEGLSESCRALADTLDIRGCVNFEFICDEDGAYWLVECNPRFAGGVQFSHAIGYDCVINHLRCFTGERIDALEPYRSRYIARVYEEHTTLVL